MRRRFQISMWLSVVGLGFVVVLAEQVMWAQESGVQGGGAAAHRVVVPRWIQLSGALKDRAGVPLTGIQGVTLALYKDQGAEAPLWLETQNVQADEQGRFSVLVGVSRPEGLPLELFTSGESRWLGLRVNVPDAEEQPRVLLVSVPYALKAADAELLGGIPASEFLRADKGNTSGPPNVAGGPAFSAQQFEAMSTTAPGLIVNTTSGPPLQVFSTAMVANLNADLLDGHHFADVQAADTTLQNTINGEAAARIAGDATLTTNLNAEIAARTAADTTLQNNINAEATARQNADAALLPKAGGTMTGKLTIGQGSSAGDPSVPIEMLALSLQGATPTDQAFQLRTEVLNNGTNDPSGRVSLLYREGGAVPIHTGIYFRHDGKIEGDGSMLQNLAPATIPDGSITNAKLTNSSMTINAGPGLSGGGTIDLGQTLALNIPNNGVTSAMIADGTITPLDINPSAATSANAANTLMLRDGSGSFSAGTATLGNLTLAGAINGGFAVQPNATSANIVGGHSGNTITAGVVGATINGGGSSGYSNRVTDSFGTIGGGESNQAGDAASTVASHATVGGGWNNIASGSGATVGGGFNNFSGFRATVAGGEANTAGAQGATVGGGWNNNATEYYTTVGGGYSNTASSSYSTVSGGLSNTASGFYSTVGGGAGNEASGGLSFAAGNRAQAVNDGAFVWGDSRSFDVSSTAANQFLARATGGVQFISAIDGSGNATAGVSLAAGGGAWTSISDRNLKENFQSVDGAGVLEKLSRIPIQSWNYKAQDASIRHMGPMAQDFYAAFGLGEDDKHITTIDPDGVALAAIQALHRLSLEKDEEIESLKDQLAKLAAETRRLQAEMSVFKHQHEDNSGSAVGAGR